jgi:IS30 family transposase
MTYTHLTRDERYQIAILTKAGHGQSEIAELMQRHRSTISRELRRSQVSRKSGAIQSDVSFSLTRVSAFGTLRRKMTFPIP